MLASNNYWACIATAVYPKHAISLFGSLPLCLILRQSVQSPLSLKAASWAAPKLLLLLLFEVGEFPLRSLSSHTGSFPKNTIKLNLFYCRQLSFCITSSAEEITFSYFCSSQKCSVAQFLLKLIPQILKQQQKIPFKTVTRCSKP